MTVAHTKLCIAVGVCNCDIDFGAELNPGVYVKGWDFPGVTTALELFLARVERASRSLRTIETRPVAIPAYCVRVDEAHTVVCATSKKYL